MRFSFPLYLLLASCALVRGQTTEIIAITPDTVIAIVNGQKFTAGEFEQITQNLSPQTRALAASDPKAFLEQYAHTLTLVSEAEKAKLHETSPYRERLLDARRQVLVQAMLNYQREHTTIPAEDVKKQYEANKEGFKQVHAKVIFVSRLSQATTMADGKTKTTPLEEITAKAATVAKKAKAGEDFVKLAKEYSDDKATADKEADLPYPIRANAAAIPAGIRDPLLAAKAGDIVGPLEHQTGFYVFRVQSVEAPEFDAVKADIEKELKEAQVRRWVEGMKAKSTVKLDNEPFWRTFAAANRPEPQPEQEPKPVNPERAK